MKIVLVHNFYQRPGGEDQVLAQEQHLLEARGHLVVPYHRSNTELMDSTPLQRLLLPQRMIWSTQAFREVRDLLRREKPHLVHVHNTFVQISPSVFAACREAGVPVVQTLHNFRLLCPAANFFRAGKICEECCASGLWRSVQHGCYRDSSFSTAAVALMLSVHRKLGTWADQITRFIALTQFAREKFVTGGLPAAKIRVKPNFVAVDPGPHRGSGNKAVFVGRVAAEKGVKTLIEAWARLRSRVPLEIFGDGPLRSDLMAMAARLNLLNIVWRGHLPPAEILEAMKSARFLVLPSENYEGFPMTIAEAFACGMPIVCSRLGAMREIVGDGVNGVHFTPGDAADLADKVDWAWNHPSEMAGMGHAARREYEEKYTAEHNYQVLLDIYQQAMAA